MPRQRRRPWRRGIAWSSANPMNEDSDIEIRPVFEAEDFGDAFRPELREQESAVLAKAPGLSAPTFQQGPDLLVAGLNESYGKDAG